MTAEAWTLATEASAALPNASAVMLDEMQALCDQARGQLAQLTDTMERLRHVQEAVNSHQQELAKGRS